MEIHNSYKVIKEYTVYNKRYNSLKKVKFILKLSLKQEVSFVQSVDMEIVVVCCTW